MSTSEYRYEEFATYAELLEWADAVQANPRAEPLRYQGPSDDEPVKVSARVDRRDPRNYVIRVSPYLLGREFKPFTADVTHLPYFRRYTCDLDLRLRPARRVPAERAKSFNIGNLSEPNEGPVHICTECKARFQALPFQSHQFCKDCRRPTHRCKHGASTFERCPANKKDGPCGDGLTRIVYAK